VSVSPTLFGIALVRHLAPGVRLSRDEPEPADLAPVAGLDGGPTVYPVFGQLYMLDGYRDRHEQHPEFDIHFYSLRFAEAERVALAVEDGLVRYPVRVHVGEKVAVLDSAEVTTATREVPWDVDAGVTRFTGSYQLRTRS